MDAEGIQFRKRGTSGEEDASQDDISVRWPFYASANSLGWSMHALVRKFVQPYPRTMGFFHSGRFRACFLPCGEKNDVPNSLTDGCSARGRYDRTVAV